MFVVTSCGKIENITESGENGLSSSLQQNDNQAKRNNAGQEVLSGFNKLGQQTSCNKPSENLVCDMMFTEGEQFAAKCTQNGGQALTCGCHSYLCSKKIIFP